jgi:hypothetical protein
MICPAGYRLNLTPLRVKVSGYLDVAEAVRDDGNVAVVGDVFLVSPSTVIGVAVGDDGLVDRFPGVEVHLGGTAMDAFIGKFEKGFFHSYRKVRIYAKIATRPIGGERQNNYSDHHL